MYTILFSALATVAAFANPYEPRALVQLGANVTREARLGHAPVVVFDLDDTLSDSRTRTIKILNEFSEQEDLPELAQLRPSQIHYQLDDTLKDLGLNDASLLARANAYWKERFFSNEYVACDRPIAGAPAYVRWLENRGARIVYLTGRDENSMRQGTLENLVRNHFPVTEATCVLLMKPDKAMDDTAYKIAAFERIQKMGIVVGAFENEPRNINAMRYAFPGAISIYVDTIHSSKPDVPAPGIFWIRDFSREWSSI